MGLEDMEDATNRLDDGNGDEGNEDDERHRADVNPSELNHWWGGISIHIKTRCSFSSFFVAMHMPLSHED